MMKTVYPFNYLTMGRATLPHRSQSFGAGDDWLWSCIPTALALRWSLLGVSCWLPLFPIFVSRLEAQGWGADTCE